MQYRSSAAKALVNLHEREFHLFLEVWKLAKSKNLKLPETEDPDYASLETLLRHVCGAARSYMVWICEQLQLPDPGIDAAPDLEVLQSDQLDKALAKFSTQLLEKWRLPLCNVEDAPLNRPEYPSRWGVLYCIDAMLEHAVMHPLRHRYQLQRLIGPR